jgi:long-chain acyl-CoA synthetase
VVQGADREAAMARLVAGAGGRAAEQPALCAETAAVSWTELDQRVNRWISVLRGRGLETGDRVALVTGNRPATFEALLACLHAGLVAVPVSWRLTAPEMAYLLADSGCRAVVTDPGYADRAVAALRGCHRPPALAAVTGGDPPAGGTAAGEALGVLGSAKNRLRLCSPGELVPVEQLLAQADPAAPAGQCSGGVMLYTSATTGKPKGVVSPLFRPGADLSTVETTVARLGAAFRIPDQGRSLLVGPWYHAAQVFFSLFPLLRGCGLVLRQRFDAAATLADLDRERITTCHLVPTQFIRLLGLDEPVRTGFRGEHLRRVWHGAAACPVEVKRRMIEWWGPVLLEYYAATEAGIVTMIDSAEWLAKPGSVGRPVPPSEVLVLDEDGVPCPAGERGQVYIRRPPRMDFHYHNAPGKTAAAYRAPGTFTVGDLGHLDRDGYLYLTGRKLDTIISGGVNIYPAEVEAVLVGHPAVRDAAVVGIPDEEFGEQVLAVVELAPEAGLSETDAPESLDAHCRHALAGYKRPRRYRVVESLPRDPNGKLVRRVLRDPYWQA